MSGSVGDFDYTGAIFGGGGDVGGGGYGLGVGDGNGFSMGDTSGSSPFLGPTTAQPVNAPDAASAGGTGDSTSPDLLSRVGSWINRQFGGSGATEGTTQMPAGTPTPPIPPTGATPYPGGPAQPAPDTSGGAGATADKLKQALSGLANLSKQQQQQQPKAGEPGSQWPFGQPRAMTPQASAVRGQAPNGTQNMMQALQQRRQQLAQAYLQQGNLQPRSPGGLLGM